MAAGVRSGVLPPAAAPGDARPDTPEADSRPGTEADHSLGYELLLYGNEQILRGSDNGTLVAFVAIAFQQIRGRGEFHNDVGCGLLLFSVLMCAVVHFSIGYAYVGRAAKMLEHRREGRRDVWIRRRFIHLAWFATLIQFVLVFMGSALILYEKAPPWMERWLDRVFT